MSLSVFDMAKNKHQYRNKPVAKQVKLLCLFLTSLMIVSLLYYIRKSSSEDTPKVSKQINEETLFVNDEITNTNKVPAFDGERIVHLDLKGAPPKVSYFTKFFPLIKKLGATGILIEYEDMFPYSGELMNISALNAYSSEDIETINQLAKANSLKVIPLVQTFGHMEFILKLKDFKEYREVPAYPQVICPTHDNTMHLLEMIVKQVMKAHPHSEIIHVGADEVYFLGQCTRCTDFMMQYSYTKNQLFLEHMNNVVKVIKKLFPNLRILMWDDQFRSVTPTEMKKVSLNENVEPVVWKYSKEVYEELGPILWENYARLFKNVWAASAFKGATASNEIVTDVTHYFQNHRGWLSIISDYKNQFNFQGIIITGWQRFDHFAALCELLPVGIPSLAMSLRLLMGYNSSPLSPPTEIAKLLHCEQPYALIGPAFGSPRCSYPGGNILEIVLHLHQLKQEYETMLEDSRVRGWMSEYNIKYSFSNPSYIESVSSTLGRLKSDLEDIDADITWSMLEMYDSYTVEEWKDTYIRPLERKIDVLWKARRKMLTKDSWPRRPLIREEL